MLKSFPSIVGVSLIILALLLGCVVLLHEEQKPTVPPPPQTTQALSTSSVPAQSEATNDNSSYRQQTSTAISSGTPASYSTTTQTASSKPQCAERDELIMVPTSTVFTVPADQEGPFCFRPVVGAGLASSDGKWTAAIESDAKGPIIYGFAASPEYKNAGEGPELYDADRNVFILLTNLITGEKKGVSLVRVAPQQVIASLKAQGIP